MRMADVRSWHFASVIAARYYCSDWGNSGRGADIAKATRLSSRAEESHLRALPEPCVNLSIHTAPDVRPLAHAASGFASSTGSSRCQMASVGPCPRLNNAAPSLQPHYRTFITTTGCSVPVLRIGTLVLAVLAA
jgi:hypothetical protein